MTTDNKALADRLKECCRDSQDRDMKDYAEPWGADVGLLREAATALTAAPSAQTVERHYMLTDFPLCEGSCQRDDGKWLTLERTVYSPSAQAGEVVACVVNGYLPRQRAVEVRLDEDVPAWITQQPGVRAYLSPQPQGDVSPEVREALAAIQRAAARTPHHEDRLALYAAHAALSTPRTDEPDATFAQWLATEMPAGTIIGDPVWWANRIARQYAKRCGPAPTVDGVPTIPANVLVSVDVSTGDEDAEHRIFARTTGEVIRYAVGGPVTDPVILCIEESRNYAPTVDGGAVRIRVDRIKRLALDCKPADVPKALAQIVRECLDLYADLPAPAPDVALLHKERDRHWRVAMNAGSSYDQQAVAAASSLCASFDAVIGALTAAQQGATNGQE